MKPEEISLIDLLLVLRRRWLVIMIAGILFALIAYVYCARQTPMFSAEVDLLPLDGSSGGGGFTIGGLQIGGIVGNAPAQKNNMSLYLTSRTLAEQVVEALDLRKLNYPEGGEPPLYEAGNNLKSQISVIISKELSTIHVTVMDKKPEMALKLLEEIIEQLQVYINNNAITKAKRERKFIEQQLVIHRGKYLNGSKFLATYYQTGTISPSAAKLDVDVSIDADIINQIIKPELAATIKSGQQPKKVIISDVPQQAYLDYLNKQMSLLTAVIGSLEQQYQMALINEAREDMSFQVLDPPLLPTGPSYPRTRTAVFASFFGGMGLAIFLILGKNFLLKEIHG